MYNSYVGDSDCHVDIMALDNIKNMNDIFDNAEDYTQEIDTECGADEGNIITMTIWSVLYMPKHTA